MALSKNYVHGDAEEKWYRHWQNKGYFHSTPDNRPPYTIVIPPPNVTGILHMGHTLNETIQDILIRHARMHGKNACWVPGSDHASIATEAKVVAMLKEQGIKKQDLSRDEFLQHAFEWKEKYGGIIYGQMKKLGCTCDWDRVTFTMDDHYYKAVIKIFVRLYDKGLIYRGARMIHWDPEALTALSDEEVEYREVESKLYYIQYKVKDSTDYMTIATTRPETIPGDSAICVHPEDPRYQPLIGKKAIVPLVNREIPIIADSYVDREFGTGCLKITPAHDINDYNIGMKHHLQTIDVLNPDGTLSEAAQVHVGEDRFEARKNIVEDFKACGAFVKEEKIQNKNGFSQRTNAVVEPRISTQWFLKMEELAVPALEAVEGGAIQFSPRGRFDNTYRHWLTHIKDWCISRQLWWGQQIPAWYDESGHVVVAETEEEAYARYAAAGGSKKSSDAKLKRDEDVLDTWFSSWLWPLEVFRGITEPENEEVSYYYPTQTLVTGQDIIFFWVARMIMAGLEFDGEIPFKDVYFTGMVRDHLGRKMSKSLGNSPDLLKIIDKYGADAVRFGIMIASPAGNDLLFEENSLEQGRNFCNKIWNALKLTKLWKTEEKAETKAEAFAIQWFENELSETCAEIEELFRDFRLSEALKKIYTLIWDDFCSWYLEWIKPQKGEAVSASCFVQTQHFFEELLALLHPFMPFVTEDIFHHLKKREEGDDLIIRQVAESKPADPTMLEQGELARRAITGIRDARNKNGIKNKEAVQIFIQTKDKHKYEAFDSVLSQQINASSIAYTEEAVDNSIAVVMDQDTLYVEIPGNIDFSVQIEKLEKEWEHQQGFLRSVTKKLSNEKFVANAKAEVVERERKKQADAQARIQAIEEHLKRLK